jgi:hypothetical protein
LAIVLRRNIVGESQKQAKLFIELYQVAKLLEPLSPVTEELYFLEEVHTALSKLLRCSAEQQ